MLVGPRRSNRRATALTGYAKMRLEAGFRLMSRKLPRSARTIRTRQRPKLNVTLDLREEGSGERDIPRYDEGILVIFVKLDFKNRRLAASIEDFHILIAFAGIAVLTLTHFVVIARQRRMRAGKPAKLHLLYEGVLDVGRRAEGKTLRL